MRRYPEDCDFVLAIVKGLVEHDDGAAYFGSTMGYRSHEAEGIARGLLTRGPKECDGGGGQMFTIEATRLTEAGREAYKTLGLDRLPKTYGSRAYMWRDWPLIPGAEPPPVKLQKAAAAAPRLKKPAPLGRCWFLVQQPSTGSAKSRYAPRFDNCRNRARAGHKTCSKHQAHEGC